MAVPSLQELRERDRHEHMVLKFGHLSKGRLCARDREIVEARRQALQRHIEDIWAEQEQHNAALREFPSGPPLRLAPRYAKGRTPRQ